MEVTTSKEEKSKFSKRCTELATQENDQYIQELTIMPSHIAVQFAKCVDTSTPKKSPSTYYIRKIAPHQGTSMPTE
eukprot:11944847-Ditylum_brightwellii.AAC.2